MGGTAAYKLARMGIQAIVVDGKAKDWQILRITKRGMGLEPAQEIVGLDNYDACERLRRRYGDKVGILVIGRAGERLYANATVAATDPEGRPCRHAGRGGVGSVMGAKLLKAIVIDDAGASVRKPARPEGFRAAVKKAIETLATGGPYGEILRSFGTPWFVDLDNSRGSLQTNNYRRGSFEKVKDINAARLTELNKARGGSSGHACSPGCVVRCSNVFHGADGEYVTAGLEYETLTFLGANLGIGDLDAIARMDRKCDGLGIDTIETGAAIGILNDVGLFEFGDASRAEELIEEIAKGSLMGRVLGNGCDVTAKVFGIDRVPTVKGQAIAAHSGRSMKGWGVTYATSPQGADHTAGPVGAGDFLNPVGQVNASRTSQIINTALDATGLCPRDLAEAFWLAAGGSILAARQALADGVAISIGGGFHHAFPDHGEGFCMIHDVAVAIRRLQRDDKIRTAMTVDCDVHQGNGTAAIFAGTRTASALLPSAGASTLDSPAPGSARFRAWKDSRSSRGRRLHHFAAPAQQLSAVEAAFFD